MAAADLDSIADLARGVLDDRFRARETGLSNSRAVIRRSANAIRSIHRGERDRAEALMDEAAGLLAEAQEALAGHPDVLHAGFVADAAKEYAEARITAALTADEELPLPGILGIDVIPYLKGLGEAVGELRRRLLDQLRAGELADAERVLAWMDDIVDLLAAIDYPDGMTGGLRRTTDVARSLTERSRADLTTTAVQERLRRRLEGSGR